MCLLIIAMFFHGISWVYAFIAYHKGQLPLVELLKCVFIPFYFFYKVYFK